MQSPKLTMTVTAKYSGLSVKFEATAYRFTNTNFKCQNNDKDGVIICR